MKNGFTSLTLALLTLVLAGCETTQSWVMRPHFDRKSESAAQVHAAWENHVLVTQDTVNNGAPLIGLAGRIYLFGDEIGFPLKEDGKITVDLYNVTAGGEPKMLERWDIDRNTLRRLCRKDAIGWGYTLFLPWATYRPDVARVQLQVRFVPEKGSTPLYTSPAQVTLHHDAVAAIAK